MKKRIFFNKCDDMRFISHLDLLRFLERVLIKGEIPVKYSQGFHPRPKISLGNPISLGTESFNEVMDIDLETDMDNELILSKINAMNILGFKILKVEDCLDKVSIVEKFSTAIYKIKGKNEDIDALVKLLSQESIIERKEKKDKIVERDLKEKIKYFAKSSDEQIEIHIFNGSPNVYIEMAGINLTEVDIQKYGYTEV
ncbi:MAG: TIGR03936 family radical SAM-associated protein [Fusobacteriaceae bacterium]|nr:TIGR03936 family radical SAM-associated protein [Fusobacteriaceae bacterium]MBP9509775.1 TIGR03936 family radical SAM-associated protein [Fusobacteriaceae bacterium]